MIAALAAAVVVASCNPSPKPREARAQATPAPSPSPNHSRFIAAVDEIAAQALELGPIAGMSIAVFAHGHPVLAKGYGFTDLELKTPATAQTSYPIASISKHLTAAAILRLADQGRLSLDDPLRRFFPGASGPIGALELRHLLQHTSGLTKGGPAPRGAAQSVLVRGGTGRAQGSDWTYSNYNFSLLGLVIEHVSGRDYASFMRDEVFAPAGLTGTGYCEDGTMVPGRGRDYLSGYKTLSPTGYWAEARFFASGGLCSTVLDLVRWEQALEAGRIISPAMLRAMRAPARLPSGIQIGYGLGTRLGYTGARPKVGHTGGGQGNKAVMAHYPDDDVTIVVLLNSERDDAPVTATDIEERVEGLFLGRPPEQDAADAARYVGEYADRHRQVRIEASEGGLTARPGLAHQARSRLVARGGDAFTLADEPAIEVRFQMEEGRARGYGRYSNGWFTGYGVRAEGLPRN